MFNTAYAENIHIAAGDFHTVGLKDDATLAAVGSNVYGQTDVSSWTNVIQVAAGSFHTIAVRENGRVNASGLDSSDQTDVSSWTGIIQAAAGLSHTVGLKSDGKVVATGANDSGQTNVTNWSSIDQVAVGRSHTVGVKTNGTVVAVGLNGNSQLNVTSWSNVTQVAAGKAFTLGLMENGTVLGVGLNDKGQLNVTGWTNIIQIVARDSHSIGLKGDGTVVSTGSNLYGQRDVSTWTDIKEIATGRYHTVGLREDGTILAVGSNSGGQTDVAPLNPGLNTYYRDADGDGYGDSANTTDSLSQPTGYVTDATDCDDTNDTIYPGADEIAWDWIDQDCNGSDLQELITYYYDADTDGYGGSDYSYQGITVDPPYGYSLTNDDCDDTDDTIYPGAVEISGDTIDQDCDGIDPAELTTYYADADNDGYGDPNTSTQAETQPSGYVANNVDCNDTDDTINPGAVEIASDGIDQDCNGSDLTSLITYYADSDDDGYGDLQTTIEAATLPDGYVENSTDCDDTNANVNPGSEEACNDIDDNCNGIIDETCDDRPGIVSLVSPLGTVTQRALTFTWVHDVNATWYYLKLMATSTDFKVNLWYETVDNNADALDVTCQDGTCSVTIEKDVVEGSYIENGSYEWQVKGYNDAGTGAWSDAASIVIQGDTNQPSQATLVTPFSSQRRNPDGTIQFQFNDDGNTDWYKLFLQDGEGEKFFSQWYKTSDICSNGSCEITPDTKFNVDTYIWWIKSWNYYGSIWSEDISFTVSD